MPPSAELWVFLPWGHLMTVALETPVLLLGLSRRHGIGRRVVAGFWLTACTYPVVVPVLPPLVWEPWGRWVYLVVAETFAPLAECGLFYTLRGFPSVPWNCIVRTMVGRHGVQPLQPAPIGSCTDFFDAHTPRVDIANAGRFHDPRRTPAFPGMTEVLPG